jgi:thiol-disulfide isomerase/thioredoxin
MYILISLLMAVSTLQFKEVEAERYTIAYFYNPGCPSCHEIAPFIEYLKQEYDITITEYNTRTQEGYRYGMEHRILRVPTMIVIIEGGEGREIIRYEGRRQIIEAEEEIAELSNKAAASGTGNR